jgi:hypothetical protein
MYKFMLFSIFVVLLAFLIFTCQEAPTVSDKNSSGLEFDGTVTPNPGGYTPPPCGRMTGGGSVFIDDDPRVRVTRGFELHCCWESLPNNLQVNWQGGNKFHLLELDSAECTDDPLIIQDPPAAPFDTYYGWGTGRLNNVPGATIEFVFTDAGEPGKNDKASIQIWDANGTEVLFVSGYIDVGNLQAHYD